MTYAIIARDRNTGEVGGAVQSHFFNVGPVALWPAAGHGVVVTMAIAEATYGSVGIERLRRGEPPQAVLNDLLQQDALAAVRQVGMLAMHGPPAAHTGTACIEAAGHCVGEDVVALGNLLSAQGTWNRMVETFQVTTGTLAERLLAALESAEQAGGDLRGKQSAALLVVSPDPAPFSGALASRVDLRVDDCAEPLRELRRLLALDVFYKDLLRLLQIPGVFSGPYAPEAAQVAERRLIEGQQLLGSNHEATFWRAVLLTRSDRIEEARRELAVAATVHAPWRELAGRVAAMGMLSASQLAALTT